MRSNAAIRIAVAPHTSPYILKILGLPLIWGFNSPLQLPLVVFVTLVAIPSLENEEKYDG